MWAQYVWDARYIDAPVLRWRLDTYGGPTQEETLYYCNDANMNVTALIDGTPGSQTLGQVVERYVYDPYGRATIYNADWSAEVAWDNSRKNEILFCGYRWDSETGLYHVRRRPYHPTLGRWVTWDTVGYVDSFNLYEYVSGRPPSMVDPTGNEGGWAGGPTGGQLRIDISIPSTQLRSGSGQVAPGGALREGLRDSISSSRSGTTAGPHQGLQTGIQQLFTVAQGAFYSWVGSTIINSFQALVDSERIKIVCSHRQKWTSHVELTDALGQFKGFNGKARGRMDNIPHVRAPTGIVNHIWNALTPGLPLRWDYVPSASLFFTVDCKARDPKIYYTYTQDIQVLVEGQKKRFTYMVIASGVISDKNTICLCCNRLEEFGLSD